MKILPIITLTILFALFSRPAFAEKPPVPQPTEQVVFKTIGEVELRLHVFKPADWKAEDRRPAIVFFFGGGWVGGSPGQFYPHCRHLADLGMVAAAAEYRVASRHRTSPFECVKDGKSAVRWMRTHAAELGINPDRIAAGGGSAGGHVAACTGTIPGLDEPGEDSSVSSRPIAMVLFNPVIDTGPEGFGHRKLGDKYMEISPVDNVTEETPPTIIFHGEADTTVPAANVRNFDGKMEAAGNRCEMVMFPGAKHGFFNFGRGDGTAYRDTVKAMDNFLRSLEMLK